MQFNKIFDIVYNSKYWVKYKSNFKILLSKNKDIWLIEVAVFNEQNDITEMFYISILWSVFDINKKDITKKQSKLIKSITTFLSGI